MAALEALALGIPVIANRVGGLNDALGNGAGVLLESRAGVAYADAVQELLSSPVTVQDLKERGGQQIAERFSAARNAMLTAALYAGLCR